MPKLTKSLIDATPDAVRGQTVLRDTEIPGFAIVIGKRARTFVLQRDFYGPSGRTTTKHRIGRYGPLTLHEARVAAELKRAEWGAGKLHSSSVTFRQAVRLHAGLKPRGKKNTTARSAASKERYDKYLRTGYLNSWMDRPLRTITRTEVRERHAALPHEIQGGKWAGKKTGWKVAKRQTGHAIADALLGWFSACYDVALAEFEDLPANPCVILKGRWYRVKAERTAIKSADLRAWYAGVKTVENEVRRDYLLLTLFTGLRRHDAASMRWADVHLDERRLHLPHPKGGEPFDLPLSDYLIALLQRRKRNNPKLAQMQAVPPGDTFVFPAYGSTGHLMETRNPMPPGTPTFSAHDLRRTFISTAAALQLSPFTIMALAHHKPPFGSTTAGYVRVELDALREPMQQITDRLRVLLGA